MRQLEKLLTQFLSDGLSQADTIIALRRCFHQNPEIANQEFKTTALLKKELSRLGLKIHDKGMPTGLWADLETGRDGPTVAVRTDIDALPVTEKTGLPFASKINGKMHACGHDVHMAVLIGTARLLAHHKKDLIGHVRFICQPAEERPPGGAQPLIAAGVLKNPKVDAILALHVDPSIPTGHIGVRDGVGMASAYDFDLIVNGRSSHAAFPHKSVDAITVAAEVISGLQQVVSRMINPVQPAVVTLGIIKGGTARNVIAETVEVEGTARSLDPQLSKKLPRLIEKTAVGIGKAFGAKVTVLPIADYPALVSDAKVNAFIADAYTSLYPKGKIHLFPVVMGGEDFAYYVQKVPGAMFRLGVANKKIGADKPWHHPAFKIDEAAIATGYTTMAAAVTRILFSAKGHK